MHCYNQTEERSVANKVLFFYHPLLEDWFIFSLKAIIFWTQILKVIKGFKAIITHGQIAIITLHLQVCSLILGSILKGEVDSCIYLWLLKMVTKNC